MLRQDFFWILPAVVFALYQVKVVWRKLETFNGKDTEIPGAYNPLAILRIDYLTYVVYFLLIVQLAIPILTTSLSFETHIFSRFIGYLLIILGFLLSLYALRTLGRNWTGMAEYRIKKNQKLVTRGPYGIIRHPIYLSVILELVGFELVANSWLFLFFLICGFGFFIYHAKNEDRLLQTKFGEEFTRYKAKTKAFIPFVY